MAGSAAADDIGWTIRHPASIFKFPNHFQGSVCLMDVPGIGKTYGTAIGIVKFNEFLYAGLTFNNRWKMWGNFYDAAVRFLDVWHIDTDGIRNFARIPQINLCLKLSDNIQLGLGGYFEGAAFDKKQIKKIPYDTLIGAAQDTFFYNAKERDNKRVRNIGFNVELRWKIGDITLYPQFMIGFPKIMGSESYDTLDAARKYFTIDNAAAIDTFSNLKHTWSSPQGIYLRGGSYIWGDIGNTFWFTGVFYENVRNQFKRNTKIENGEIDVDGSLVGDSLLNYEDYDTIRPDYNYHNIHYFLAFVPPFSDDLYFSPEYNGGIGWTKSDTLYLPSYPQNTTLLFMYHSLRLGIEKFIEDFWWFDRLALRCGLQGQWNKEWRYKGELDESIPWKSFFWGSDFTKKEAKVSGGFGVSRGRGTFDISCDFLKWQGTGVLTGPSAAMATITVDFSRKKEF